MRPRNSSASSIVFNGANSAKWSLPKYDCPAPAATMSESNSVTVSRSSRREVTLPAARSIDSTSPSSTSTFFCFRNTIRVAGAMSPTDRMPVATWYSRGWKR